LFKKERKSTEIINIANPSESPQISTKMVSNEMIIQKIDIKDVSKEKKKYSNVGVERSFNDSS